MSRQEAPRINVPPPRPNCRLDRHRHLGHFRRPGRRAVPFEWMVLLFCILLKGCGRDSQDSVEQNPARKPPLLALAAPAEVAPQIRVNVTGNPKSELRLSVSGPCRITLAQSRHVLWTAPRIDECSVAATPKGITLADRHFPSGRIDIRPEGEGTIRLGRHAYRGVLRLIRRPGSRLIAVNVVPLPIYLASVIDSEMPAAFPDEARKAQAVVARTYALYQMQQSADHPDYDLFASVRSQKYLGHQYRDSQGRWLAGESESSRRAVRDTAGQVCVYEGRLFCTYFSAVCGGRTTRGLDLFSDAAACLQPVTCDFCRDAQRYRWEAEIPRSDVQALLAEYLTKRNQTLGELHSVLTVRSAEQTGTAEFLVIDADQRRYPVNSVELRSLFSSAGLHSPSFALKLLPDRLEVAGRGHGHGVGLCQWGARGQALSSRSYLQILAHYYPGSQVVRLQLLGSEGKLGREP